MKTRTEIETGTKIVAILRYKEGLPERFAADSIEEGFGKALSFHAKNSESNPKTGKIQIVQNEFLVMEVMVKAVDFK